MPEQQADALIEQLQTNYRQAELTDLDRAMLEYSEKLTVAPSTIEAQDVDKLKTLGLDDRGIHDLCSIVAYFAFANRIANGLGIELEE